MKMFCLLLALVLCIGLIGCAKEETTSVVTEETVSEQISSETGTEVLTEPSTEEPSSEEPTTEVSSAEESESEEVTEEQAEESVDDGSYLLRIPFADQSIFDGPSYDNRYVGIVEVAGTYTIVEEYLDNEGNLWGKLKSGAGWVDLTDVEFKIEADVPITANYASKTLLDGGNYLYFSDLETEYSFTVAFRAYETLYNVRFCIADLSEYLDLTELYTLDQLTPDKPLVANIYLPGDMSAYAICFSDSLGNENIYIVTDNGRNNALTFVKWA